jgi:hypothetical protein
MAGGIFQKGDIFMAKDDYFKIIYVILQELYGCKKQGCKVDLRAISPQRFQVPEGYLLDILADLLEERYIKGFEIIGTKTGRAVCGLEDITITMKGIEYLQDNSKMKQVYNLLKEVKDWVPGL